MNNIQLITIGLYIATILLFLIPLYLFKRKQILSFFYPNKYVIVEMLELDNSTSSWIERKNDDLRFEFNKGYYNMFHQDLDKNKHPPIYREGRLAKLYYHEGFSEPMDFRQGKITGNPQISRQYEEIQLSKLFEDNASVAQEFFKKYGVFIAIGLILLVVYILIKNNGGSA